MYLCVMYSSELIKGTLKTIVLNLLKDNERMYGYEITQKVKDLTDSKIQITEGALYPTLHALEKQGDVTVEKVYIGKRVRKYYILTDQGITTVTDRVNELSDFMKTMRFLLDLDSNVQNV
ncbi:MAG: PadR family transcriptional regulator PadR [Crocinitomix sp.]|jgi:PadR family transcriptional regulator PadR